MSLIQLRALGVLSPHPLFSGLDLAIHEPDRIGLVAANGAGKTTMLRCIAGTADPTTGDIIRRRSLRLAYVEQDIPANLLPLPLEEALRRALPPAEREANGWKTGLILDQLETPEEIRALPLSSLSGGWQRLALIARAWLTEPDLMLLDEPTNHLDLQRLAILENWIAHATEGVAMLIASHDRAFLDRVTNRTLFLRPEQSRCYAHPFTRARALLADDDAAQEHKATRDAKEVDRLRRNAGQLKNVGINSGSDLLLKKSKYLTNRAEALEQTIRPVARERSGEIRLTNRGTHAKVMLTLDNLAITAPDGRPLFRTGKLTLFQHERLVIGGPNGVGKSQFLGLLRRALLDGEIIPGLSASPSLVTGYLDQHMSQLPAADTAHGFITARFRLGDQRCLSLLAGAGFDIATQRRPISTFSGGQKTRLGLLVLRLEEPNFYLLDEPTNHVDIPGQERLEQEILAHDASCILVSHDRAFLAAIGTRFMRVESGRLVEDGEAPTAAR
jgi:ATPase subunit of ABC transporter with duplicated ATPase domains